MKYLYWIIATVALFGCSQNESIEKQEGFSITGNHLSSFSSTNSRNVLYSVLPDGSQASFFSTGGIEAHNEPLIYNQSEWKHSLQWNNSKQNAQIHVYSPSFPQTEEDMYESNGHLKDFLIYQQEVEYNNNIELSFNHLFSALTFQVNKRINRNITQISITPSVKVTDIDPYSGEISFAENSTHYSYALSRQEDCTYSFIIPPAPQMSVNFEITYQDETSKSFSIAPRDYQSNKQYVCQLISENQGPGIYNAEDFIAFTHLYNGEKYQDRTLNEFGTTHNGITTYYLQNDIYFTEEESKQVQEIGFCKSNITGNGFKDHFDGQGYTLFSLNLKPYVTTSVPDKFCYGVFAWITPTGKVENLNISTSQVTGNKLYSAAYIGILAGLNFGTIQNCHITGSQIMPIKEERNGGIAGYNSGYITNCSVNSTLFSSKNSTRPLLTGGIVSDNNGKVLNCYVSNCDFSQVSEGGGISHRLQDQGYIKNCYTYKSKSTSKTKYYDIFQNPATPKGVVKYCYYHHTIGVPPNYSTTKNNIFKYDINTLMVTKSNESKEPLLNLLNYWVENIGKKEYPSLYFHHWKTGENPPITLTVY